MHAKSNMLSLFFSRKESGKKIAQLAGTPDQSLKSGDVGASAHGAFIWSSVFNGGRNWSISGRARYVESSLIWILPRASGSVARTEKRWFLNDSASLFTKFFMVRKCISAVAAIAARNFFVSSGHCANSCMMNFFCSFGKRSLLIISW